MGHFKGYFDDKCVTPFPRSETAGARLIANAWSAYYEALWRGDPAASEFAEWLAKFWEPSLGAQTEPPMRRARSPLMDVASSGSSGTVGSTGSFPANAADIYYRASRSLNISGRGSWRPLRNPQRCLQAQVGFLRYDEPGTSVPGLLF